MFKVNSADVEQPEFVFFFAQPERPRFITQMFDIVAAFVVPYPNRLFACLTTCSFVLNKNVGFLESSCSMIAALVWPNR